MQHYLYGRAGQAQHGVDIALRARNAAKWIGIQCKLKTELNSSSLTEEELIAEYEKSCKFNGGLEKLYIATTCQKDTKIQDRARLISESWQRKHPVEVLFWDDVEDLLERHPSVANRFYPDAFAPSNCLNESEDGEVNVTLQARDWEQRLSLLFSHPIFITSAGSYAGDLMTIVSELVDNLFHKAKGCANRVKISLAGRFLDVSDDGVMFDSVNAQIELKPEMRGLLAIRSAIQNANGDLAHSYLPANPMVDRFNKNRFEIRSLGRALPNPCSASGPATFLLNRDAAAEFVRQLDIPEGCKEFTLRLYAANDYMNFSAASQLLSELLKKLGGKPLRVKISRDCAGFLSALEYAVSFHPDIAVEYV